MLTIDLNCDMGEGMPYDADIMPYISSANIACSYHASDEEIMKRTIELALEYNVAIGAHPGFADKENFGRKDMFLKKENYHALITEQLSLIKDENKAIRQVLQMVKEKTVTSVNKNTIPIVAETICLHSDGAHPVEFARLIHQTLQKEGVIIKAQ